MHPSDEALLELALSGDEGNAETQAHIKACVPCSLRYAEVMGEQEMLRKVLAPPAPRGALERRLAPRAPAWAWALVAAVLAFAVTGILLTRSSQPGSRPSPMNLVRLQRELKEVVHKLDGTREILGRSKDEKEARTYVGLLEKEEKLYLEALETYLGLVSPLSEDQRVRVRETVHEFTVQSWGQEDLGPLAARYQVRVREILSSDQYIAFEEYCREEIVRDQQNDIEMLTSTLAADMDLRYSEADRLRKVLESEYPRMELPMLCLLLYPADVLLDHSTLAGQVRSALDETRKGSFDAYLATMRVSREAAGRVAKLYGPTH